MKKFSFIILLLMNLFCEAQQSSALPQKSNDSCVLKFVDKILKYKSAYVSFPAILASDERKVRIVMESQAFLSYLNSSDSIYQNQAYLKYYLTNLISGKSKFIFYKSICTIKNISFILLPEKNFYKEIIKQPEVFLKKVLVNYSCERDEFSVSFQFPEQRYYDVISGLFDLGFLFVEGDVNFIAQRVKCNAKRLKNSILR